MQDLYAAELFLDVQVDDAAYAGAQKAQSRDGEAEALAALEAEVVFKYPAVVERLAGALAVAEGQQYPRRREEVRDDERGDYGYSKAENALKQVGRNRGHARVEYLHGTFLGQLRLGGLEGRGDEAQGQGVVCDDFERIYAVPAEELGFKHVDTGGELVQPGYNYQYSAAQHGGGYQRRLKKMDGFLQNVCGQQTDQQHRGQIEAAPYTKVPEIFHFHHLC